MITIMTRFETGNENETTHTLDKNTTITYSATIGIVNGKCAWCGVEADNLPFSHFKEHEKTIWGIVNQLKQQHRAELEGLKKEQKGIDFIESEVKRIWVPGHKLTQDELRSLILSECAGYNTAVNEINKAITNLLEQKGK